MQVGDVVDDFELPDQTGTPRRLSTLLADGPVVLFFYPAAMTAGCTKESCHFRDLKSEFEAVGAQRVGISSDKVEKQKEFSDKHDFDYPLLSDPDRAVAQAMGVKKLLLVLPNKRTTFVIDTDRRILAVLDSQTNMESHADEALEVLRKRQAGGVTTFVGVHLTVEDMARSLAFYRIAGLAVPDVDDDALHVSIDLGGGRRLELSNLTVTHAYDPGWRAPTGSSPGALQFELEDRQAVDDLYDTLVAAGHHGHLAPKDAFFGSRYAEVDDPDGNIVGLRSPRDPAFESTPAFETG